MSSPFQKLLDKLSRSQIAAKAEKGLVQAGENALSREEAAVAQDLLKEPTMAKLHEGFTHDARQADLSQAFTEPNARNSMSAFEDQYNPNFTMGDKVGPVAADQVLTLRNASLPPLSSSAAENLPALRNNGGLPAKLENDIIDVTGSRLENAAEDSGQKLISGAAAPMPTDKISKLGPTALIGTLGTLGMLNSGINYGEQPPPLQQAPVPATPASVPPEEVNAAAPVEQKKGSIKASGNVPMPSTPTPAPEEPGMTVDFGEAKEGPTLKDAQDRQNNAILTNQLGKAGEIIGSSIARTKPVASDAFDSNIKQAGTIVQQHKDLMESEKNDPNSPLSKGMKQFMKSFGFNVQGDASADELMKLSPLAEKYYQSVENRKLREDESKQRHEDNKFRWAQLAAQKDAAKSDKKSKGDTDRIDKAGKTVVAALQSRSAFGIAAKNMQSVQNAEALLDGTKNLDDIDNRQIAEMARVLDRVLSQGSPTISGTEHLTPETARMKAAKYMEFYGNEVQGAHAGSFVNRIKETLDREKEVAKRQIASTQGQVLAPYSDLKDDPRMQTILLANDLPPDIFDYAEQKSTRAGKKEQVAAVRDYLSKNPGSTMDEAIKHVATPSGLTDIQKAKVKIFKDKNPQIQSDAEAIEILKKHGHL